MDGRGAARAGGRGVALDRFESMGEAFHERLRQAFLAIAAAEPDRCAVIDASQGIVDVTRDVLAAVQDRLKVAL